MPVARLILVCCLFFTLYACETVCEEIDYTPKPDGDFLAPDGDKEFIPLDGDQPADGDTPVDGDLPDGDQPADGDVIDGDLDVEIEQEAEEEVEAEAELVPYAGYLPVEATEYGLWRYDFSDIATDEVKGVASLWKEFSDETALFETNEASIFANPPTDVTYFKSGTILWSAYVPGKVSVPEPVPGRFFLRRAKNNTGAIDLRYHDIEAPEVENAELVQAGLLPGMSVDETLTMIMLAYAQIISDTDAFLIVQSHRVTSSSGSATTTPMTVPLYVRLIDGLWPDTTLRILHDGFSVWINAGNSIHKFHADGTLDSSYRISYNEQGLSLVNVIDMDMIPNEAEMVLLSHLIFDDGEERILWSVHQINNPAVITSSKWLPEAGPHWRTAMSPSAKYALAIDPEPGPDQMLYIMNMRLGGSPVRTLALQSFGRPVIRDLPDRLLRTLPVTWDGGATVDLQIEEMNLDEIWQAASPYTAR
jgi:hypothetical protein